MIRFPHNFLWGAATSAYQVEGGNVNSDWGPWEERTGHEQCGEACRHYSLYAQDLDLARSMHHNAHRLSIEWARIEPQEGHFNAAELRHYIDVIKAVKERGMQPVVTLHHFTNPLWLTAMGGWTNPRSVALFTRYSEYVGAALAPYVNYWTTINEPTIYFSHAYILGHWPPQLKSMALAKAVHDHFLHAHIDVYRGINAIYKDKGLSKPMISIAQHMQAYVPCTRRLRDKVAAWFRHKFYNMEIIDHLVNHGTLDFIGLNYYSRQLVDLQGWGFRNLINDVCINTHDPKMKNSLGWDIYPQGLQMLLLQLKHYNLPVLITENGICTEDDQQRWEFLRQHLIHIHAAVEKGVSVMGYLYWSLLDNFEWDKGFGPRFGLIQVDYKTFERTLRASAHKFGHVCAKGELDDA